MNVATRDLGGRHDRLLKLGFELASTDGFWPPVDAEWLWFEPLGRAFDGPLKLVNVPFFVSGMALEDVISVEVDEFSVVKNWSVCEASGNDLVWLLRDDADLSAELESLRDLGCRVESWEDYHFAVSVPQTLDTAAVDKVFDQVEGKNGQIAFPVWRRGDA